MTREEHISNLETIGCDGWTVTTEAYKSLQFAIKALKQEPCEDAINRQAVIDAIDKWVKNMGVLIALPANEVTPLFNSIHALPPVTPQPKIGRWIDDKCSICGKGIENLIDSREWYKNEIPNYCPFCGARVIESE